MQRAPLASLRATLTCHPEPGPQYGTAVRDLLFAVCRRGITHTARNEENQQQIPRRPEYGLLGMTGLRFAPE